MTTPLNKHDQVLARTLEVERAVLGGVLIDNERLDDAREFVTDADFFRVPHRMLFAAILRLADAGKPIDTLTVKQELSAEELDQVGGPSYIAALVDGVPSAMNVSYYAREVAEKATMRALAAAARRIVAAADAGEEEPSTILDAAERTILAIRDRSTRADLATPLQRSTNTFAALEIITSAGGALRGVPTGLRDLDSDLRGLHPGNLVTLGARPSQGKSALALQFAMAGGQTAPSLFFSLEMSADELNLREVTMRAGVNSWRLTHGHATPVEQQRLAVAATEMQEGGVYLVDSPQLTVGKIRAISRRFRAQHGVSVVIVDYLQLMTPERRKGERAENRTIELGEMSRSLKGLARELQAPVVLLSQLSRQSEARDDKRPQLSDLRESGAIEQDSDVVLLLHRPNAYPTIRAKQQYKDHYAEVNIAKQRNGPTGIVTVAFYREQTVFANYTEEPRGDQYPQQQALV